MKFDNVQEVAQWRLCVGCGVCAYICPENNIRLVDVIESGIRPLVDGKSCSSCDECLKACPGLQISHDQTGKDAKYIQALRPGWGPVLEVWEGHATDPDIRYWGLRVVQPQHWHFIALRKKVCRVCCMWPRIRHNQQATFQYTARQRQSYWLLPDLGIAQLCLALIWG